MAGLLTGSRPDSFPISYKSVEKVCTKTLNGVLQQRGLSGILTRFPFYRLCLTATTEPKCECKGT